MMGGGRVPELIGDVLLYGLLGLLIFGLLRSRRVLRWLWRGFAGGRRRRSRRSKWWDSD